MSLLKIIGGGSTLPPTSPMALRPKKKTRVEEEEEEEEEMEDEEEEDEEEEEVRVLCLNPEDMRDYRGELAGDAGHQVQSLLCDGGRVHPYVPYLLHVPALQRDGV